MAYSQGVKMAERRVARMDSAFTLLKGETGKIHSRMDFFGWGKKKAKCDLRYGWKPGPGRKCVRSSPEENPEQNYGTDTFLLSSDRDSIEFFNGSEAIDDYQKSANTSRKNAVEYYKDVTRLMDQQDRGSDFNAEIGELNKFAKAREAGDKSVKNAYGGNVFVSSVEKEWIDKAGGPESIKRLSKDKSTSFLKDVYATQFSKNPQQDLDSVNKYYFK